MQDDKSEKWKFDTTTSRNSDFHYQILDNENHIQHRHTDKVWSYTSNNFGSESSIEDEKNGESNKTQTNRALSSTFNETTNENTSGNGKQD